MGGVRVQFMEIDTRHLRLVKTIADEGSITRAASVLGMTQPALTRQLRRVEDNLGGRLFSRSHSGVEQTSLGRLVVGRANAVLSVIDSLQCDVAATVDLSAPAQVRVGVRSGNALVGLMRALRATMPSTDIVTDSEYRIDALIDLVCAGRLDFAVIHEFVGHELVLDPRLVASTVGSEPAFVLMSPEHRLADEEEVDLADLADEQWLLSPLDADYETDCMTRICHSSGFTPQVAHYLSDIHSVELIRMGEAIAMWSPATRERSAVLKPVVGSPMWMRRLLITSHDNPLAEHLDKLARFITDGLAELRNAQPAFNAWKQRHPGHDLMA